MPFFKHTQFIVFCFWFFVLVFNKTLQINLHSISELFGRLTKYQYGVARTLLKSLGCITVIWGSGAGGFTSYRIVQHPLEGGGARVEK